MSRRSKNSTRSFDFSLVGEEKPLILEREEPETSEKEESISVSQEEWGITCPELFYVDLPALKPIVKSLVVEEEQEEKEEPSHFIPPKHKIAAYYDAKDPSHGIEGYLSIPDIQSKFQEVVNWEKVKPWISVSGYLRMAEKNLKDLVQIEKLADQSEGFGYGKSGGRLVTLEKWMESTKDYVEMAVLLSIDEDKQEYILPIDLRPLLNLLEIATEQRKMRKEREKGRIRI